MPLYIIVLELKNYKKQYEQLYSELKYLGSIKMLNNAWCIKRNNLHSTYLRNYLVQFIYDKDRLVVTQIQDLAPYCTFNLLTDLPN